MDWTPWMAVARCTIVRTQTTNDVGTRREAAELGGHTTMRLSLHLGVLTSCTCIKSNAVRVQGGFVLPAV